MRKLLPILLLFILFPTASFAFDKRPNSDWVEFDNNKVHFQSVGDGKKALIFIHGWACSAYFWKRSVNEFPEYRVIAVDLPGHGKSDKPEADYSMEYFANSIKAVMKKANVKKAVLVGHSMGTPVIRQFYRLYPKEVAGLVIVDGSLRTGTEEQMEQFISPFRANFKESSTGMIDGMLQPVKDKNLKQEIRASMTATPDHVGLGAMEGMIDRKIWFEDKINVPVLAIMAKSPWWKADEEEYFKSVAPKMKFQMWEGVSHFLMMEKPEKFNAEIKAFVMENKLL